MHWVEMLPDTQTPSWLGLPSNAEKVLLTTQGECWKKWSSLELICVDVVCRFNSSLPRVRWFVRPHPPAAVFHSHHVALLKTENHLSHGSHSLFPLSLLPFLPNLRVCMCFNHFYGFSKKMFIIALVFWLHLSVNAISIPVFVSLPVFFFFSLPDSLLKTCFYSYIFTQGNFVFPCFPINFFSSSLGLAFPTAYLTPGSLAPSAGLHRH